MSFIVGFILGCFFMRIGIFVYNFSRWKIELPEDLFVDCEFY